ncbi:AAA family ATPase [Streptomyces sp. J2-1]|uniref:AAA family ATPase n=1 Tax=Streptomyces corallincola TaxID=2851888 RepID=UPI001C391462|nr:AAA family ATPase [Streptomyces corallincola]MBV2355198.1 AAA family ATPase [Streptomyces corallincola]
MTGDERHGAPAPVLAAALVRAREAAGLTQGELAERSGLSVRAIRNLETGRTARPRRQSLVLLTGALGLPAREAGRLLGAGHPATAPEPPAPAELPAAPRHRLAGRGAVLADLTAHLTRPSPGQRWPAVVVGPPGAGKTALVLRAAHEVRGRFPDGQVFVDLHPASRLPVTADTLVRRVLRSLGGVPAPESPEEARARLRDTLSRRRALIVLDNADSEAQVRPLLVDDARGAVLVAARCELFALPTLLRRRIGPLEPQDAHRMLAAQVGAERLRAERRAGAALVEACAGLPLALHIAGLWLAARPGRSPADLADRLADEGERLRVLRVGDLSVWSSVTAYHRALPPPLRTALRQLLPVARDFGIEEMTAHVTPDRSHAVDLLEELLHRQLVEPGRPDRAGRVRHRLYDAVRLYVAHGAAARRTR